MAQLKVFNNNNSIRLILQTNCITDWTRTAGGVGVAITAERVCRYAARGGGGGVPQVNRVVVTKGFQGVCGVFRRQGPVPLGLHVCALRYGVSQSTMPWVIQRFLISGFEIARSPRACKPLHSTHPGMTRPLHLPLQFSVNKMEALLWRDKLPIAEEWRDEASARAVRHDATGVVTW